MSTRTTSTPVINPPVTEAEMREAFDRYVTARCELNKISADAQAKIEAIKQEAALSSAPHTTALTQSEALCLNWSNANKHRFETVRKMEMTGGHKMGFQSCPPSVDYIKPTGGKGKQNEKGFVAACKAIGRWARGFIRTVEEPNKEAVLTWRAAIAARVSGRSHSPARAAAILATADEKLARIGVRVQSRENFVIDLNLQPEASGRSQ